jgi:Dolichyl-phosphate-mannose-protein mannosyltransferase
MSVLDLSLASDTSARRVALLGRIVEARALAAVLAAFVTTRLVVFFVIFVSSLAIPLSSRSYVYRLYPTNPVLDGLTRWDGGWYYSIVTHGYVMAHSAVYHQQRAAVFFPLYPLLVKALATLTGSVVVAGVLISNAAFLVALGYLYALVRREFDHETAARAVFYLAAAPAAVFFSAMYTESVFVALVTATFYHARRGQWLASALAGALAAATRNTGVVLAAAILVEGLQQQGLRLRPRACRHGALHNHVRVQLMALRSSWRSTLAAAFVPMGLLALMIYLAVTFGDPLAFIHSQAAWGTNVTGGGWPNVPLSGTIHTIYNQLGLGRYPWTGQINHVGLLNVLATLGFAPLVIGVALKMRPAYAVFVLPTYVVPLLSGHGVLSMIRFVLMLVPCFVLLAWWGRRPWVDRLVLTVFLPMMTYLAVTFSHWYKPY